MILIDMKMPETCFRCRFCIDMKTEEYGDKYVKCAARESYLHDWTEAGMVGDLKPDWCPLNECKLENIINNSQCGIGESNRLAWMAMFPEDLFEKFNEQDPFDDEW